MKKVPEERQRYDELHQGPAQEPNELTERSEKDVAGFVDREIDVVDEAEGARVAEYEEPVGREDHNQRNPRVASE